MAEIIQQINAGIMETSDEKSIPWRVTATGQFVIGRCSDVLPDYQSVIEDVTDKPHPETPAGIDSRFVYNHDIGFVVQGAFEISSSELTEPLVYTAGELMTMWRFPQSHIMKSLAPINSYVCITPRDISENVIWNRSSIHVSAGIENTFVTNSSTEQYLFVAKGTIEDSDGNDFTTNGIYKVNPDTTYTFTSFMNGYMIYIWR